MGATELVYRLDCGKEPVPCAPQFPKTHKLTIKKLFMTYFIFNFKTIILYEIFYERIKVNIQSVPLLTSKVVSCAMVS